MGIKYSEVKYIDVELSLKLFRSEIPKREKQKSELPLQSILKHCFVEIEFKRKMNFRTTSFMGLIKTSFTLLTIYPAEERI